MEKELVTGIDGIIENIFALRKKITNNNICESCNILNKEIEKCKKNFKKYNEILTLAENIQRLQKECDENNERYFKLNTKFIKYKEQYDIVE
jgi:phage-related tail protein